MLKPQNGKELVTEGAAHSDPLFLASPEILRRMTTFMRGEYVSTEPIRAPVRFRTSLSDLERMLR